MLVSRTGKIRFADPVAQRWLTEFFGSPSRPRLLPRKVRGWLGKGEPYRTPPRPLVAKRGDTQLCLKRQNLDMANVVGLLLELIKGKSKEWSRRHRALTPREHEVLFWLTQGKSNSEIASILGLKSATVGKHLERIYPKLGVENRTAAVSLATSGPEN